MRTRTGARRFWVFGLTAVVLTACGSSSSSSTSTAVPSAGSSTSAVAASTSVSPGSSTATPGSSTASSAAVQSSPNSASCGTTQGVTADSIKLGGTFPLSGPLAVVKPIDDARKAYFDQVNDAGGINGRKISWTSYDDTAAADKALANSRRLVEEDKIFAYVGSAGTTTAQAIMNYLQPKGIPFLFPVSGSSMWSTPLKPLVYGYQPAYVDEARMFANYIADTFPGKKVGFVGQNDDAGTEWLTPFKEELTKRGISLVASERFDFKAQDFSATTLNLRRSEADVVAAFARVDVTAKLLTEGNKLGYKPTYLVSNIGFSRQLFKITTPELADGTYFAGYYPQPEESSPALAEHTAGMAKYAPGDKVDDFTMLGWSTAQLIVEAIRRAGPDLTCKSFIDAMDSIQNWTGGLTPPITLSPTDHQAIQNQRLFVATGTSFVAKTPFLTPDGKPLG